MEVMIETSCGIDVHQKSIVCCILDGPLESNKPKKDSEKIWYNNYSSPKRLRLVIGKSRHTCLF